MGRIQEIDEYLPLVEQIVAQVAINFPRHVDRGELVRAGVLGLVEAAHRFDDTRGVPFDRFDALRIRGAILDAVRPSSFRARVFAIRAFGNATSGAALFAIHALAAEPVRHPSLTHAVGVWSGAGLRLVQDRAVVRDLRTRLFA